MTRKRIVLFILSIILFSCSRFVKLREENYTKELSVNLIENGSFETYQEMINNTFPGWIIDNENQSKVSIDSTRSFIGQNSLKISQPSREMQLVSKPFNTNHRNIYGVKLSAKSVLKKIPIVIHFLTFSENGKVISRYYKAVTVDTKWKTYSLVADFLKVDSEFGRVFITIPQNDSVLLIDNVDCRIIDAHQKK